LRAGAELEIAGIQPDQRFSLRAAARILEVPAARLRALARAGFLAPQRGPVGPLSFGFHDLLLLRTTKGLLESGVPMRRIRRIWASLREQLQTDALLTSISIHTDGDAVVASDGDACWQPDSGQFLLNFEASEIVERAADTARPARLSIVKGSAPATDIAPRATLRLDPRVGIVRREDTRSDHAGEDEDSTAEEWYEAGCELEATSPEQAREAYERALELDPDLAGAHVNLGRHRHVAGELGRAEPHYRDAARLDPDDPTPHFNLGVLLEEVGRKEEAIHAYRQAILRDPDFADAHCNLGLLLETLGRNHEAVRHLMAAHQLSGSAD
jgi:tetratricopeptide (TPR) repeat protein